MNKKLRNYLTILLVLALIMSMTTALAADSTITFKGMAEGFDFAPGSGYTETDLFDGFKNVMPGDKLTEEITVSNEAADCDYINLYLKVASHDEQTNPLTYDEAFENTDGNDQAKIDGQRDETVATMQDFLSKLTMRIYNGESLIYDASPSTTGALAENVHLGQMMKGEKLNLRVELDVPAELGNEYAHRVGEVDWVFLAEGIQMDQLTVHKVWEDNGYPERPVEIKVNLLKDGEVSEEIVLSEENAWTYTWDKLDDRYSWTVEEIIPEGYEAEYKIEDNNIFITNKMDYVPPVIPDPVDITVVKVWEDDDNERDNRPEYVNITLYRDDEVFEKITLNDACGWTHSWTGLDGNYEWSILETGIPKGYTPSYSSDGTVITITNTETLIETGQLTWPVIALGGMGIMMIFFGIIMMKRNKKDMNA